jgi:GT2 family glycosyltransferase
MFIHWRNEVDLLVQSTSMDDFPVAGVTTQPKVAAVVLNYREAEDTKNCVLSLRQCGYQNLEIVLVDNASQNGSAEELAGAFPDLPLLIQPTNLGYAGGNNAGIRFALTMDVDYILISNDDVVVTKGFLEPMISMMERDKGIGVVSPKVFYSSSPQEVFAAVGEFNPWLCTGMDKGRNEEACRSATLECDVDYVPGVLLLLKREVFETVGLFDERFFMYFEDVEFSRRVRTRYRMAYTARSVAFHKGGAGKGWRNYSVLYLYYHTRNRIWAFSGEGWLYRLYVLMFTMSNAIVKAVAVSSNCLRDPRKTISQWKALCNGFLDGIIGKENSRGADLSAQR